MGHLDEFPSENGYQSYLFEELQPYDAQILEEEYNNWLKERLDESGKKKTFLPYGRLPW